MSNSQTILDQIAAGDHDNATVSAAIDSMQEQSSCPLLTAVLEVARVVNAAYAARVLGQANKLLSDNNPLRWLLRNELVSECLEVHSGSQVTFTVIEGDAGPVGFDTSIANPQYLVRLATITVGAEFVVKTARRLANRLSPSRRAKVEHLLK